MGCVQIKFKQINCVPSHHMHLPMTRMNASRTFKSKGITRQKRMFKIYIHPYFVNMFIVIDTFRFCIFFVHENPFPHTLLKKKKKQIFQNTQKKKKKKKKKS